MNIRCTIKTETQPKVWPLVVTMLTGAIIVGIAVAYFVIKSGF